MRIKLSTLMVATAFSLNISQASASQYTHWPAIQAALSGMEQGEQTQQPDSHGQILTKTDQELTRCLERMGQSKHGFDEPLKGLSIYGHEFNCHRSSMHRKEDESDRWYKVVYSRSSQISHVKRFSLDEQIRMRLIVNNPEDPDRCRYGLELRIDFTEPIKISEGERKAIVMSEQDMRESMRTAYQRAKQEGKNWTWRDSARWIFIASASRSVRSSCSYGL